MTDERETEDRARDDTDRAIDPDTSPDAGPDREASGDADREARRAIEAVVLASTEPVEARLLAQLVELPVTRVEELCDELARDYEASERGFVLARVAGGYRYQTHPDLSPYVERFVLEGQTARLSGPALETLAIIAYKQPISRGQMSAIRGVNVEATLTTLLQRGYVQEVGRDPGPGAAVLYGTTSTFLERIGLHSVDDLPSLGDFVPDAAIVEALERGLRVNDDPTAPLAADDGSAADEAAEVDGPGDERVPEPIAGEAVAGDAPDPLD